MNDKLLDGEYIGVINHRCWAYTETEDGYRFRDRIHDIAVLFSYFNSETNTYCIANVGFCLEEDDRNSYHIGDCVCFKINAGKVTEVKFYQETEWFDKFMEYIS